MDHVVLDLGKNRAHGIAFVALSRTKRLDHMLIAPYETDQHAHTVPVPAAAARFSSFLASLNTT